MSGFCPGMITEILLRLPAKTLLRFRCVSTSFSSLIDSPGFVKDHLHRSIHTKTHLNLILCSHHLSASGLNLNQSDIYAADFDSSLGKAVPLGNPLKSSSSAVLSTEIVGSCNGLILLKNQDSEMAVWNPFTRRYKRVDLLDNHYSVFGFGYDSASDDYKIVKLSRIMGSSNAEVSSIQVWVFGLRSSSWRRVRDCAPDIGDFMASGKYAEGVLYWICCISGKILAFDLTKEMLYEMPQPPCKSLYGSQLEVLDGWLCVRSLTPSMKAELYVGERHEYNGGNFTWKKKLYCIQTQDFGDEYLPLTYSKEKANVVLIGECRFGSDNVVRYDVCAGRGEVVEIRGSPRKFRSTVCWGSLVSVGDTDGNILGPELGPR